MILQYVKEREIDFKIRCPQDIVPLLQDKYSDYNQEAFFVATLDGAHNLIKTSIMSIGLVNKTIVHPREVYCEAVREMAAAIIVAHNHPSGSRDPSMEDTEVTSRLKKAGDILGIPMLDHIIFTKEGYYSFLEEGTL